MSDRKRTLSSGRPSGTFSAPTSANGTRAYSAWPPANPPVMWEYPKMPAVEKPHIFSAIHAFGLDVSHSEKRPLRHDQQRPHEIGNATTTRSPVLTFRTSDPVST